jgi:hypothetical protein
MEAHVIRLRNSFAGLLNQARVSPAESQQLGAEQQHATVHVSVRDAARLSQVKLEPESTPEAHTGQAMHPAAAHALAYDTRSIISSSPAAAPAWATFSNRKALDVSVQGSLGGKLDVPLPFFAKERRWPEDSEHMAALSSDSSMLAAGELLLPGQDM